MLASPSFFVVAAADDLAEVALLIKDADADHRQTEITCRLQLVAGDVAEATRVDREGLAERELHAEVGHASQRRLAERLLEPGRRGQVPTSLRDQLRNPASNLGSREKLFDSSRGDGPEHGPAVVRQRPQVRFRAAPRPRECLGATTSAG